MITPEQGDSPESENPRSQNSQDQESNPLNQDGASLPTDQALELEVGDRARALMMLISTSKGVDMTPEGEQFDSLRDGIRELKRGGLAQEGWSVLREVTLQQIASAETLTATAELISSFQQFQPSAEQWERVQRALTVEVPNEQNQDTFYSHVLDLVSRSQSGSAETNSFDSLLEVCRKGRDALARAWQPEFPVERREQFMEVARTFAQHQPDYKGMIFVEQFFQTEMSERFANITSIALQAGVLAGEELKPTVDSLKSTRESLAGYDNEYQVLELGLYHQLRVAEPARPFIENARANMRHCAREERAERLVDYRALVSHMIDIEARFDQLTTAQLDEFAELPVANQGSFAQAIARHDQDVERLDEVARESGVYTESDVAMRMKNLREIGPNPGAITAFHSVVFSPRERASTPRDAFENISKFVNFHKLSREEWSAVSEVLRVQVESGNTIDDILKNLVAAKIHSGGRDIEEGYFKEFCEFCNDIAPAVRDLKFVMRESYDFYKQERTPERLAQVAQAVEATAELVGRVPASESGPGEIIKTLLASEGAVASFNRGLSAQKERGFATDQLLGNYSVLKRELSESGIAQLEQVMDHQIESGRSLNLVFRNFGKLAETIDKGMNLTQAQEAWEQFGEVSQEMRAKGLPLDLLGPVVFSEYRTSEDKAEALEGIEAYLVSMEDYLSLPEALTEDKAVQNLLGGIAELGMSTEALPVLDGLLNSAESEKQTLSLSELASEIPSDHELSLEGWRAIGEFLPAFRGADLPLERLVAVTAEIDKAAKSDENLHEDFWKHFSELGHDLTNAQLSIDVLSKSMLNHYSRLEENQQILLGFFSRGFQRFGDAQLERTGKREASLAGILSDIAEKNYGLIDHPAMVHKLNLIVEDGGIESIEEFREMIRDLKLYALTDVMQNGPSEERQNWARQLMARTFNMGGPPYVRDSEEARVHHNQTMEVVNRALRDNKGFGGFAIDCRGVPRSEAVEPVPPMMVRFATDSADQVFVANASTNEHYPGKGIYVAGIVPEKVFAPDPNWEEKEKDSPFWQWTEEGGLFSHEYFHNFKMEDFGDAEFLLLRGVMAVSNPGNERFELDGVNYSYVVFNRHFYPGTAAACLVPTEVLMDQIMDGLIDVQDYRGFDASRADISNVGLDPKTLRAACEERGLNLLDLTYGSVIGGGLCNAYPPESSPHYDWEKGLGGTAWKDSWGHTHKSWLVRGVGGGSPYNPNPSGSTPLSRKEAISEKLNFSRELQEQVNDVVRGLQSELDAFRFGLSFYKMGTTLTQDGDDRDQDEDQEEDDEQFMEEEEEENPEFDETTVHEYRYRMLEEAYRWHHGAMEGGWPIEQIPVLHFAYVLDPNTLPPADRRVMELDLATMVLKTPDGEFELPVDATGYDEEAREIWRKQVVPYFQAGTGWEPRILMRGGAYSLHE